MGACRKLPALMWEIIHENDHPGCRIACPVNNLYTCTLGQSTTRLRGRRLFVSYCWLCHGVGGKGDGPLAEELKRSPADLTTTVRSRSDTILKKIISGNGRQTITGRDRHNLLSDAMPEWKGIFSDAQVEALIAYLRFLGNSKHRLMGDPEVGMPLYHKYCQVCHGEEGGGDGIMTVMMRMKPMDHTNSNETNRMSNEELVSSILDGKGKFMPGWRGIISRVMSRHWSAIFDCSRTNAKYNST